MPKKEQEKAFSTFNFGSQNGEKRSDICGKDMWSIPFSPNEHT